MNLSSFEKSAEVARLLFVSRDSAFIRVIWSIGESSSWQMETVGNVWEAMERVQSGSTPDLLLLDLPQGESDGLHIMRWLHRLRPGLPIVLIGHANDVRKREDLIRLGARDFLTRPIERNQLAAVIQSHLAVLNESVDADISSEDVEPISEDIFFIGVSPVMRKVRAQAASLAQSNVPILILGEGGSGKETVARLVHKLSLRSGFQFTTVNCAALPGDLLEREIFGYEPSDAMPREHSGKGKLETAVGGTILLKEITEMPLGVQANLMRVLRNKRLIQPGSSAAVEVDVRVIASSTGNIERAVSERRIREDLYYALSAHTIHVPPLRERKKEIRLLFRHLMHRFAKQYGMGTRDFSPAMLDSCHAYAWPGNLRELEGAVKRYLMTGDRDKVFGEARNGLEDSFSAGHWSAPRRHAAPSASTTAKAAADAGAAAESLRSLLRNVKSEAERNAIADALGKTGGNRKAAAGLLKISYRTLLYKIEQYQIKSTTDSALPAGYAQKNAPR
jgi:two-component system, NtrC family, response regulator AtoC